MNKYVVFRVSWRDAGNTRGGEPILDGDSHWIEYVKHDGRWRFNSCRHSMFDATHFDNYEDALSAIVTSVHDDGDQFSSYIVRIQPNIPDWEYYKHAFRRPYTHASTSATIDA